MSKFGYQALGFGGGGSAVAKVTRQDDLSHWWKGEDLTSAIVGGEDLVSNNGATTSSGTGVNGEDVLLFDGTDDWFHTADVDVGPTTAITVNLWVKSLESSSTLYADHFQSWVNWGDTPTNYGAFIGPHPSLEWVYLQINLAGTTDTVYMRELSLNTTHGINPQNWNMWTFTWASGNSPKMYANTTLVETGTAVSGAFEYSTAAEGSKIELGRRLLGNVGFFNALLQQVRIYGVELSAGDVSDIYNSGDGDWS